MDIRKRESVLGIGFIVLVILAVFLLVKTYSEIKSVNYLGYSNINVTGQGKVPATPDIATFNFSLQAEAKVVADAQKIIGPKSDKLMTFLKGMGIADKDIQTANYSIYPRYVYRQVEAATNDDRSLAGYEVTQTFSVKLRDVAKAGQLLTGIGTLGVSNISGPIFSVDTQEELIKEARAQAIADARANAEKIAKDLGVRLGKVTSFSEGAYGLPAQYEKQSMSYGMGGGAMDASIPVGQNEITSQVNVSYEIR